MVHGTHYGPMGSQGDPPHGPTRVLLDQTGPNHDPLLRRPMVPAKHQREPRQVPLLTLHGVLNGRQRDLLWDLLLILRRVLN